MKAMKRAISLLLVLVMVVSMIPTIVNEVNAEEMQLKRYTVLVLDNSGTSSFRGSSGSIIYTADTAITDVKKAANKFLDGVLSADGSNYVAVVSFRSTASVVSEFSNDISQVSSKVNGLTSSETVRDISAGLAKANALLADIPDGENVKKNVVLFTTGMTNDGAYNYTGKYNEETVGSQWRRSDTQVKLYAYANYAHEIADDVKEDTNLYVIGLFQTMEGMPEEGHDVVEFFKLTASDLASSSRHYYPVDNPEDLEFTFGDVADAITGADTDGDGLLDSWEENGLDIDADGTIDVPLNEMGADPQVPDLFVEVDWMVQPEESVFGFVTQSRISLAPSENAMRIVYNSFKDRGINLHIDAGPDSVDFVTGKTWGSLSGGNEVPYEKNFQTGSKYEHWSEVMVNNFAEERRTSFRYCMFINKYNNTTSSGLANGMPGQYFLVANQQWVRDTGDVGVAGTFMHELGHTLGLCHAGFDHDGNRINDENNMYKSNYLSIMNYLYQTSGLTGTNSVDYSRYELPDLNENALSEQNGIDPNGVTAGTGLGAKLIYDPDLGWYKPIIPIANVSVDFNGWWGIQSETVDVDLNKDGVKSVLVGMPDWEHIVYAGGDVGFNGQVVHIEGVKAPNDSENENLRELTFEEALENGVLGNSGSGALEAIGPYTLFVGDHEQSVYVRVKNMSAEPVEFKLSISASEINEAEEMEISLDSSVGEIAYLDIPVSIINAEQEGKYSIDVALKYSGETVANISVPVELCEFDEDDMSDLLDDDTIELPDWIRDEYSGIYDELADDNDDKDNEGGENEFPWWLFLAGGAGKNFDDVTKSDWFYDDVDYVSDKGLMNGTSDDLFSPYANTSRAMVVTILYRMAGEPYVYGGSTFADVTNGQWYTDAVIWAAENDIVGGYGNGAFGPNDSVTREQLAAILYRYAQFCGENVTVNADLSGYADYASISSWARTAMEWASAEGLINGRTEMTIAPSATANRAELAAILHRFCKKVK